MIGILITAMISLSFWELQSCQYPQFCRQVPVLIKVCDGPFVTST